MRKFGKSPQTIGFANMHLPEMMHYLYLPVSMNSGVRLPQNLECCREMIEQAMESVPKFYFVYLSAVRGIASPGNALNRPGWHSDGFGTNDLSVIWWKGEGTRFAIQEFFDISSDDSLSLAQFDEQVVNESIFTPPAKGVYLLDQFVIHAVPVVTEVSERQFVKLSFSNDRYNLEGNSHNYLFDYAWPMQSRKASRNLTTAA